MEPADSTPVRRSWPRRLLNLLEVDRAVFFALLLRGWQLFAGAISLVLITIFFTVDVQGFYYTFASLIALQSFFELGFNIVVVNLCSHEWSSLKLDRRGVIEGDARALSRLVSLGRLLFGWYALAALLFITAVGAGGAAFLSLKQDVQVSWQQPWFALVVLSGLLLWALPFNALLEGCNQVASVNLFRLIQAVTASLAVWVVMVLGGGLWAAVAATAARLACDLYLLLLHYGKFFRPFFRAPQGARMNWRQEVWPMQWRLGISGVFAYFAQSLFIPVMFHYHSPAVAGQMGITWTLVTALQAAAIAWVQARVPRFGMLISQKQFRELERVFTRVTLFALGAMVVASVSLLLVLAALEIVEPRIAARLLRPVPTGVFLLAAVVQVILSSLAFYVRAHKQEPFLVINVIYSLAVGLSVWQLGAEYGPLGAGASLLVVNALFALPAFVWVWFRCRSGRSPA